MLITNEQLAESLNRIAEFLEEYEENPYRIRAYKQAANSIKKYPKNIHSLVMSNIDLTIIPKVGKKIAIVIKEIILSKNLNWLPQIHSPQQYPKKFIHKKRKLPIVRIYSANFIVNRVINQLSKIPEIKKIEFSGDYRRKKETLSELIIIIIVSNYKEAIKFFHNIPSIKYIIKTIKNKTIVELKNGMLTTLYAIEQKYLGATLLQTTGSVNHFKRLQTIATTKKLKLTEKGLFNRENNISSECEEKIYTYLGLSFIPPELREDKGEIEASSNHTLPTLIELTDIKGDLHCHTNETDGSFTLEEMVSAAQEQGYQYVAITDHSQSLKITHGMNEKRLLKQIKLIDKLNEKLTNFTILKSMEIDILENGNLDLSTNLLKELDLTVCSVHSKFGLSLEKQTERILKAMDNPFFNILGHATGRLMTHRKPYFIDMERILSAAKDRNCFIEVNAQPARLDINDIYCKKAKEIGVKLAISSDAHSTKGFNFMILGVNQARRGWIEKKDVINTYDLIKLKKILKRF